LIGIIWLYFKLWPKYGNFFYKRDGKIELEQERIPIWAWVAYAFTFIGPAVLNELEMLSVRWALAMALASFGVFSLYAGKKHKEITLGAVYGLLCLAEAVATVVGVPAPFAGRNSYFASLLIYIIGAGLITIVVVHIYNRKILRKIKEMRSFGEQHTNRTDT
jgi:FtsH-binding integral membrane protein